jgi:hypothetical protein
MVQVMSAGSALRKKGGTEVETAGMKEGKQRKLLLISVQESTGEAERVG